MSAPVRAALVGAGEFGATFLAQARRVPGLSVPVVCDSAPERARAALLAAGLPPDAVHGVGSRRDALAAIEAGRVALLETNELLSGLPLDVVLEATGDPEAAAGTAEIALESGYGTVLATKEAEVLVGPELARRAGSLGLAHRTVEGDQPALLIALVARARSLGLEVVAAGKSTESDYVYDPEARTLACWGRSEPAPDYERAFAEAGDRPDLLPGRVHPGLATVTVPDLCEMAVVANHCGLAPDRPGLHAPVLRVAELPRRFAPAECGGLLGRTGVVDVFTHLRRPDEISFAGGVFVVVAAPDPATGRLLAGKGIPASLDGRYLLLHNPVHLLGVEAVASVLAAGRGESAETSPVPSYDLVARAGRDIAAGQPLTLGARHTVEALEPEIRPARALGPDAPIPYYLAAGHRVVRPVKAGALLTGADVAVEGSSARSRLRRAQDERFFGQGRS